MVRPHMHRHVSKHFYLTSYPYVNVNMGTSTSVRIYLEMCIPLCVYVFDRSHSISDYESLAVYWQQEGKWEMWMSRATPKQTPHMLLC